MTEQLGWGPVVVEFPDQSARIGYYDDDDVDDDGNPIAIVHFSPPPFLFTNRYYLIPPSFLAPLNTDILWTRRQQLQNQLASGHLPSKKGKQKPVKFKKLYALSLELSFIDSLLSDRMLSARKNEGRVGGQRVFISHSSLDMEQATWLSVDLASEGHAPWLDEWQIKVGESIPSKIAHGIDDCDYLLVLLSPNSVESGWVEREWSAKYWSEVEQGQVSVIPVLIDDCKIPTLLRTKKYADIRNDYRTGLEQILEALAS
ncbi:hypothetical protein GCM10009554_60150 [Kribbella koreensis]|uniref:TIR domain-containing protein n=1 Tax=Kribbella koreensis TaxID=57909 RepID=A0ABN1RBG9_9ACTN